MGNPHAVCFLNDIEALPDDCFSGAEKSLDTFKLNEIGAFFEIIRYSPQKAI